MAERGARSAAPLDVKPLLVRNLDTGEARPVTHGTDWTAREAAEAAAAAGGGGGSPGVPVRVAAHRKARNDFRGLRRFQVIAAHAGPVRKLAVSVSGRYLASAGADGSVHVWRVVGWAESGGEEGAAGEADGPRGPPKIAQQNSPFLHGPHGAPVDGTPYVSFLGHTLDVVDLSWSKNDFLLSAGMDKTMRLWHPSSTQCLRLLPHMDYVTSVTFHPEDEQICVSATAAGKLRLWHLKERKLLSLAETDEVVTATTISPDGRMLLAGTVCGRCKFYALFDEILGEWQLIHTTQMDVRSRKGKNKKAAKISGITHSMHDPNEVMISSNDSRLRLYKMDDNSVVWKYAGHVCNESQLAASFSPCGRFVLSGSENKHVFIWEVADSGDIFTSDGKAADDTSSTHRDRNLRTESFVPHDTDPVCAAIFARTFYFPVRDESDPAPLSMRGSGLAVITASEQGEICVFACL